MDITLSALDAEEGSNALVQTPDGSNTESPDTGFVDDLATCSSTNEGIQNKSDIVSAATLFFGLQLNVSKLEFCKANAPPTNIVIHTHGWTPHTFTITSSGPVKYLGFQLDLHGINQHQFTHSLSTARQYTRVIQSRQASPETKYLVATLSVHKKLQFALKYCRWPLSRFQELDKPFNTLLKHITHNLASFPNDLLYTPLHSLLWSWVSQII
jgi:hypothetical protein